LFPIRDFRTQTLTRNSIGDRIIPVDTSPSSRSASHQQFAIFDESSRFVDASNVAVWANERSAARDAFGA
jgi:phosphopantothenate synthetase